MTGESSATPLHEKQTPEIRALTAHHCIFSDTGTSRSTLFAAFLILAIVRWMGSGLIFLSQGSDAVIVRKEPKPVAETVTQFYEAEGQALLDHDTMMRAELSGDIGEVFARKG